MRVRSLDHALAIGNFFYNHRLQTSLLPEDVVAANCVLSCELLNAYEIGGEQIPIDTIYALTNLYGIPPDEVLNLFYDLVIKGS